MNDPQNLGLGELGQRVQAMSDPLTEPRLRPYQGAPLPGGPSLGGSPGNGRPIPAYESFEEFRVTPVNPAPAQSAPPISLHGGAQTSSSPAYGGPFSGAYAAPSAPAQPPLQSEPLNVWEHVAQPGPQSGAASSSAPTTPPPASPQQSLPEDPNAPKSGLQRAINAVRSAIPIVQKLLPLLDGNFATAISSLVVPHQPHHPPPPPVNLDPLERGLAEIHNSHRELRGQVAEQGTTLKRVEDQLERVREATDRNTLEQQELMEDLRSTGSRLTVIAVVGAVLLLVSLGLNVYFLFELQHILH
jgi:hypothetical protein